MQTTWPLDFNIIQGTIFLTISESRVHTGIIMKNDQPDIVGSLKQFFTEESPITVDNLAKTEVLIPNDKHEEEGSKEYSIAYALVTTLLNPKLGAAKHFIVKSKNGEVHLRNANYKNIHLPMISCR